jgi:hypothetical protein
MSAMLLMPDGSLSAKKLGFHVRPLAMLKEPKMHARSAVSLMLGGFGGFTFRTNRLGGFLLYTWNYSWKIFAGRSIRFHLRYYDQPKLHYLLSLYLIDHWYVILAVDSHEFM